MSYREDYEREKRKLKDLIAERERLTVQILAGQRRVIALGTLLDPHSEEMLGTEILGLALRRGRLTDAIRQILAESPQALTTSAIVTALQRLGFDMAQHKNPPATVNAICNRLVQQKFAREVKRRAGERGKRWEAIRA